MKTPLSVYLPFNRDALRGAFEPAKSGAVPPTRQGHWLIVQDQGLLVEPDGDGFRLPRGAAPDGLGADAAVPADLRRETLVPMRGTKLPDELLSLGGMAMQGLWWESTSGHCPRCGTRTERIAGEWGKRCGSCR